MRIKIAVNAATGRMGQQIINEATSSQSVELVAAFCRAGHAFFGKVVLGKNLENEIKYTNNIQFELLSSQVVIDFSLPSVSLSLLETAVKSNTPLLIGTTGFNQQQKEVIKKASEEIPIMLESNTSIGANMVMKLLSVASKAIGQEAHIEIIEYHHKNKVDAPSGTAIKLGDIICEATNSSLEDRSVYDRRENKQVRTQDEIGVSVVRAGDIVGKHQILFALDNENITIEHEALSRECFAVGAVKAAQWLTHQKNGLYSMQDYLKS